MENQDNLICISDDDDDVVPLKLVENQLTKNAMSYEELYRYSMETCEFCQSIFHNKYDILLHNMDHIIVPLINQNVWQCKECLYYFTSIEELLHHKAVKHIITKVDCTTKKVNQTIKNGKLSATKENPTITKEKATITKEKPTITKEKTTITKEKTTITKEKPTVNRKLTISLSTPTAVKEKPTTSKDRPTSAQVEPPVVKDLAIKKTSAKVEPIKIGLTIKNGSAKIPEFKINQVGKEPIIKYDDTLPGTAEIKQSSNNKIKNRLIFEDDIDQTRSNGVMNGFDSFNVKLDDLKNHKLPIKQNGVVRNDSQLLNGVVGADKEMFGRILVGSRVTIGGEEQPSVHYDDLMKPGLFRCRRCRKTFPNRFQSIAHETTHLKIKKRSLSYRLCCLCDRYIVGNHHSLRHHTERKHPDSTKRNYAQNPCKKCGLKYHNMQKHNYHYHYMYICHTCGKRFESEKERDEHCVERKCDFKHNDSVEVETSRIRQVCEVCCLFLKDKQNTKYNCVGEYSKMGERQMCELCGKEFFEVKLIRMKSKRKHMAAFQHVEDDSWRKKQMTNEHRLKNIQKRLKKLNILSRFYYGFYFITPW